MKCDIDISLADWPVHPCDGMCVHKSGERVEVSFSGITYHQWLVGMALQGVVACGLDQLKDCPETAIALADLTIALLEQRRQ